MTDVRNIRTGGFKTFLKQNEFAKQIVIYAMFPAVYMSKSNQTIHVNVCFNYNVL